MFGWHVEVCFEIHIRLVKLNHNPCHIKIILICMSLVVKTFSSVLQEASFQDGQERTLMSTEARNVSHARGIPMWWCLFLSLESSMIFPFLCALILRHFAGLKVCFFELSLCIANFRLTRIIFVRKFWQGVRMFDWKVCDNSRKIVENRGRLSSKIALTTFAQYCRSIWFNLGQFVFYVGHFVST